MVWGLLGPWTSASPGSYSKLNGMMIIYGEGADLAGLDKTIYKHIYCILDGSGLLAGHRYHASVDSTSWVDETAVTDHTHTGTDDGGSVLDVIRSNPLFIDTGPKYLFNVKKADWNESVTGGASIVDDTDGTTNEQSILLHTNAGSGDRAMITVSPALAIDFSQRSFYQTKVRIDTLSSLNYRTGIHSDAVTAVDSNNSQYCAEICTATNNNWFLRTADGSAHSASDSTIAATTSRVALKLEHYPDLGTPEVDLYIDANAAFQKTSDVRSTSGDSGHANLMRHSIKNSTTADRPVYVYGSRVAYVCTDNWV